ncbi:ERCC1-LIKE DNA EXCISION REPAIR PROTEIN [Encephalitozoon cuniculi GB-M1]|uniref:ERCC1-LIKE DNA EXCISION REPAIR PROTEIN n=2 Tax=Encephalitozoon cuniculi TaxID=6035 RepID=Q8SR16_ENCCU|nr:nucleotide excision repair endonuclease NEF1 subunit RAD10 [Encephalitozoon cuniculi GB-M1]AGE96179.1 ercc1-like DNA excision repair protein [Encephalitozoon cuniculi]KMV65285.1 nucleotide excision repair endonuclease NEF1subunit RAD10 [Encephalitozoon cuniculi EcunIII-L]CAD25852.1 ERCC1-LIKE DNA EXCISION REPAIR PROTEIN [Encephalitozoon cuniculi GB-M1]
MIKVSPLQKGNSVLGYLSNTSWHYDNSITPDYEINSSVALLFLSLRFHSCKPEYIHKRISKLKPYKTRVLLVHVDIPNYSKMIRELFETTSLTMVLGFSVEECSRYIQGFNIAGRRSIDVIRRGSCDGEGFLCTFPKVNKSDAQQILGDCGTLQRFFGRSSGEMERIQGLGKSKAEEIIKYLNMQFE